MRPRLSTSARAARLMPLALVVGLLTGCQVFSPIQTDVQYNAADGVPVDLGEVQIRGLVVVAAAKGSPGTIVGSLNNDGAQAKTVSFVAEGADGVTVEAAPFSHQSLSTTARVTLPSVSVAPGDVLTLQVSTPSSGANLVQVPVLPPTGYYQPFTPETTPSGTATPEPAATPTESPSTTPAATPTTSG